MSLPLWERGLKLSQSRYGATAGRVAPLVGAWIEISWTAAIPPLSRVAPLVGAWIEIGVHLETDRGQIVAPLVGAWIEISYAFINRRRT